MFFSLKLLTNNYKLNVLGNFLVHLDLKDFKSLFIIGELFGSIMYGCYKLSTVNAMLSVRASVSEHVH